MARTPELGRGSRRTLRRTGFGPQNWACAVRDGQAERREGIFGGPQVQNKKAAIRHFLEKRHLMPYILGGEGALRCRRSRNSEPTRSCYTPKTTIHRMSMSLAQTFRLRSASATPLSLPGQFRHAIAVRQWPG